MKRENNISRGIVNAKKRKENEAVRRILEHENSFKVINIEPTEGARLCEEENFLDLQIAETKAPIFSLNNSKLKPLMRGFDANTVGLTYNRQLAKFFVPLKNRYAVLTDGI